MKNLLIAMSLLFVALPATAQTPLVDATELTAEGLLGLSESLSSLAEGLDAFPTDSRARADEWRTKAAELRTLAAELETLADELGGDAVAFDALDLDQIADFAQGLEGSTDQVATLLRTTADKADDVAELNDNVANLTERLGFLVSMLRGTSAFTADVSVWVGEQVGGVRRFEVWATEIYTERIAPALSWLSRKITGCSLEMAP